MVKNKKGFSLIEMLIAIGLFAVITIIVTQSLASSLKNSRKSESMSKASQNVDFVVSTMERLLRNAQDIDNSAGGTCRSSHLELDYTDEYGNSTKFVCSGGANGYIASGSGNIRLTSTNVKVDCSGATVVFDCPVTAVGVPKTVLIKVKAQDANLGAGAEGASVTSTTKVNLRNYTSN